MKKFKDGEYTVREIEPGRVQRGLILGGIPKSEIIRTDDRKIKKGSIIKVRGGKLISVISY